MTVNEFFKYHNNNARKFSVEIYEINENVQKDTDVDCIQRRGLSAEWANAEIYNWYVSGNTFYLDVIK